MATAESLLASVETAIETRLAGGTVESYSIRGRNIAYVKLDELFKLRRQLTREVELASAGGFPVTYGVKDRRIGRT